MAAVGLNQDIFDKLSSLAKEKGSTTQEVVSHLLQMQMDLLGPSGLQEVEFRKGKRGRKSKATSDAPKKQAKSNNKETTAVVVNDDTPSTGVSLNA